MGFVVVALSVVVTVGFVVVVVVVVVAFVIGGGDRVVVVSIVSLDGSVGLGPQRPVLALHVTYFFHEQWKVNHLLQFREKISKIYMLTWLKNYIEEVH